jgi:hypothetical protein
MLRFSQKSLERKLRNLDTTARKCKEKRDSKFWHVSSFLSEYSVSKKKQQRVFLQIMVGYLAKNNRPVTSKTTYLFGTVITIAVQNIFYLKIY